MPFNRPSLQTLIARNQGDIESNLPGSDAKVRRSNLGVIARLIAGTAHGLYGFIDWASRQILPFEAEAEELDRHANFWLSQPRKPAVPAQGNIQVTGTNGTLVPAATIWVRADGAEFESVAEATIDGATSIEVEARVAGAAGNTASAAGLVLASPIAGVNGSASVMSPGLTGGADVETDDALRARVLARPKQPPHGGAKFDYVTWALEVPGVTRAWSYPLEQGDGTVTVRFMRDDDDNPIPDSTEVDTVQAYIEERYPVTGHVFVVAPLAAPIDFEFSALTPDDSATRAAITEELRDLISREAVPGGTLLITHIREVISAAAGEHDYVLVSPAANVVNATGYISTLGNITWPA